jgi:hypothetical protein
MSLKFLSPVIAALLLFGGHQVYSRSIPQPPEEAIQDNIYAEELNNLALLADQLAAREDEKGALVAEYQKLKADGQADAANTARKKIVDLTTEEFKRLEGERRARVDKLEERLKVLKEALGQREANSDKIVQRRVSELLGESDELSWDFDIAEDEGSMPLELLAPFLEETPSQQPSLTLPGERPDAPNPDLALGYGLSISQLDQLKKVIAEREKLIETSTKRLLASKNWLEQLADKIQGEKFGDKTLNENYSKILDEYRENAARLRELQSALQDARMQYEDLDLRLIPLRKQMDRIYGSGEPGPAEGTKPDAPAESNAPFDDGSAVNPLLDESSAASDPFANKPNQRK